MNARPFLSIFSVFSQTSFHFSVYLMHLFNESAMSLFSLFDQWKLHINTFINVKFSPYEITCVSVLSIVQVCAYSCTW